MGTLIATLYKGGLMREDGSVPRLGRVLIADFGRRHRRLGARHLHAHLLYRERRRHRGGRPHRPAAVVVAVMFLACLLFAPLALAVPGYATAPALLVVALAMIGAMGDLPWDDAAEAFPAAATALAVVFTFSIATGIGLGFITYGALKLMSGRFRDINAASAVIAAAFLLKLIFA